MGTADATDPQDYLYNYLASVENLAPEVNDIFEELSRKELEIQNLYKSLPPHRSSRPSHVSLNQDDNLPSPISATGEVRRKYQSAEALAEEKAKIAQRAFELIASHLRRLESDLQTLSPPPSDVSPRPVRKRRRTEKGLAFSPTSTHGRTSSSSSFTFHDSSSDVEADAVPPTYLSDHEEPPAADEPVYCICRDVSHGDMVACDSKDCEFEWFHYGCVNLTGPPEGRWYCPNCRGATSSEKARGRKRKSNMTIEGR